jgi:hypothetical protein
MIGGDKAIIDQQATHNCTCHFPAIDLSRRSGSLQSRPVPDGASESEEKSVDEADGQKNEKGDIEHGGEADAEFNGDAGQNLECAGKIDGDRKEGGEEKGEIGERPCGSVSRPACFPPEISTQCFPRHPRADDDAHGELIACEHNEEFPEKDGLGGNSSDADDKEGENEEEVTPKSHFLPFSAMNHAIE